MSIRRACEVIRFDPRTYRYKSRRHGQAALEQRIREICQTRVRFVYRRVHVLLRREGWEINAKKTYRIYRELGMQLWNKTPKRRVKAKLRDERKEAVGPNDIWAMPCPTGDCAKRNLPEGTSSTISSRRGASFACSRWWTHSRAMCRCSTHASPTAAKTSLRPSSGCANAAVIQPQLASFRAASSSRSTWTYGLKPRV